MQILLAPGAFKHSLAANAVAMAIAKGLERSKLQITLHYTPIADGGNGTLDIFLINGGKKISVSVNGPLGYRLDAPFGLLPDGKTAVIEMALASGRSEE